jgi:hypothetical protein
MREGRREYDNWANLGVYRETEGCGGGEKRK